MMSKTRLMEIAREVKKAQGRRGITSTDLQKLIKTAVALRKTVNTLYRKAMR